jgi:glutamate-ammonia-ligase adenylyltransferase
MSFVSDLDLILIYDAPPDAEGSDGPRPLSVPAYYARLSQRLIGAITAATAQGRLYEVDLRLRPSGASGPIASRLDAFATYQREAAWTWEHMALTRARPVAGDAALCGRVGGAIAAALAAPRAPQRLVADVAEMRRRIEDANPRVSPWDLRNRRGGLTDLEFIVQYLMLREAARAPQVLRRETGAALAALGEAGALPPAAVPQLDDALTLLRHARALLAVFFPGVPQPAELEGSLGQSLARCAGAIDFGRFDADISAACARVRGWYDRLIATPARRVAAKRENPTGDPAQ